MLDLASRSHDRALCTEPFGTWQADRANGAGRQHTLAHIQVFEKLKHRANAPMQLATSKLVCESVFGSVFMFRFREPLKRRVLYELLTIAVRSHTDPANCVCVCAKRIVNRTTGGRLCSESFFPHTSALEYSWRVRMQCISFSLLAFGGILHQQFEFN